jgi:hypothetical protein
MQRPSSRFTVGLENVTPGDTLIVEISHEAHPGLLVASFELPGTEVVAVKSIQFDAQETEGGWQFTWSGASPTRTC